MLTANEVFQIRDSVRQQALNLLKNVSNDETLLAAIRCGSLQIEKTLKQSPRLEKRRIACRAGCDSQNALAFAFPPPAGPGHFLRKRNTFDFFGAVRIFSPEVGHRPQNTP
jgi:hypothetical protein